MKPITAETYYRRSLALPLVLPLIAYGVGMLAMGLWNKNVGSGLYWLVTGSLFFGGIPYLLLVGILLRWSRGKTERQIAIQWWLAPLWMAGLLLVGYWAFFAAMGGPEGSGGALLFAGFGLIFGYAYVLMVAAGLWLFRKFGLILPSETAPDRR